MRDSYFGVLGVIAVPERRIPQPAIQDMPLLCLGAAALLLTAALAVAGMVCLTPSRNAVVITGQRPMRAALVRVTVV
jgi:hypothetical protein